MLYFPCLPDQVHIWRYSWGKNAIIFYLLTLTHDLFPDTESRQQYTEGWEGCLANPENSVVQVA